MIAVTEVSRRAGPVAHDTARPLKQRSVPEARAGERRYRAFPHRPGMVPIQRPGDRGYDCNAL